MTERTAADRESTPNRAPRHLRHRSSLFTVLRHPKALWRFLSDRGAPLWPKILAILTIGYVILPIDAVPDVIPILGWLDDLGAVTFALGFIASRAAKYIDDPAHALPGEVVAE